VHELHRDVLRVGGRRTVPEGQKPPSSEKAPGHLVAGFGQSWSFSLEERFEDPVAAEQFLAALYSERVRIYLAHRLHLNPVKPASGEEFPSQERNHRRNPELVGATERLHFSEI
jgi:hypothetical protein